MWTFLGYCKLWKKNASEDVNKYLVHYKFCANSFYGFILKK